MDPSTYFEILGIPDDSSIDTIEETYRRLVVECENSRFNINPKKRIEKLTKVRDYLVNQKKKEEEQQQKQLKFSHNTVSFIPQNTSTEEPENSISYGNDFSLSEPLECFKRLNISEDSSIETIEEKRQYYITKSREFTEENLIISAKIYQEKIKMCEKLINYQNENLKFKNELLKNFCENLNTNSESAKDSILNNPSECIKKLNLLEDSSAERIQSKRQYFMENISSGFEHKQERVVNYYGEKLELCDTLIQFKTDQMGTKIQPNSFQNKELKSKSILNEQDDLANHYRFLEIPNNSPVDVIEKAYQRLLYECNFPWGTDSVDKENKLTEAYEYLKKIQNEETLMETDEQSDIANTQHTFPELHESQANDDIHMDHSSGGKIVDVQNKENDFDNLLKHKIRFDNFEYQTIVNETGNEPNVKEITVDSPFEKQIEDKSIDKEINDKNLTNNDAEGKVSIKKDLLLSFEDIFRGLTQKVFVRLIDGNECIIEKIVRIKINPGILPDTEVPCPAQGSSENAQTEFILVIKDKPNQKFKRLNDVDIEYTAYITKDESINGCELSIPTLENDPITMTFEDEITEDTDEEFTGRGLPLAGNKKERGKLVVTFKITDKPNDRKSHEQSNSKEKVVIEKQISKAEKQRIAEKAKNEHLKKSENRLNEQIKEKQSFLSLKVENNLFNESNANQIDQNNQSDERDEGYVVIEMKEAKDSYIEEENKAIPQNQPQKPQEQLPPNEFDLSLTLEEIFRGDVRSQIITTKIVDNQGIVHQDTKTLSIKIDSRLKNDDKITFEHEGDMCYGKIPADVIFTVCEKPNSIFKRIGCDLEYVAKITQKEAILGGELIIPPLNGNQPIKWKFEGGITIGTRLHISRNKLPVSSANNQRGDLIVIFEILDMQEEETEQDESLEHDVNITLEQIFNGCNKRVKITRNIIDVDGNEREEEKILTMDIKPGTTSGTAFTFPREGDQYPGCIPADIVFVVQDKPNDVFRRIGSDIEHTVTLTKSEFNNGGKIVIPTLDGKPKELSLDGIINEKTVKKFANCGLPFPENPTRRGNLLVKFKIVEDPQDEPILNNLELSLEEILTGCVKQLNVTRKVFDYNGNQLSSKEEPIEIVVERGAFEGQKFVFEKHGDKNPGKTPADVVFVVRYKKNPRFEIKGYDLYYKVKITESEAKNGIRLEIPAFESEPLIFNSTKIIKLNDEVKYSGYGMPYSGGIDKRGDLFLRFNIVDDSLKDPSMEKEIALSLEQIYFGCEKKMHITRTIVDRKGIQSTELKLIDLKIPAGTESGGRFIKHRFGDHLNPNRIPGDIIFIIREIKHAQYVRKGNDLEFIAKITDSEAKGGSVQIPMIDGGSIDLSFPKKIKEDFSKTFQNAGMPIPKQPNKRGNLIVRFNIIKDKESLSKSPGNSKKGNNNKMPKKSQQNPNKTSFVDQRKNDEPLEYELPVTLEDILLGCTKRMRIKRIVYENDGSEIEDNKIETIEIPPGTKTGTKFKIEQGGDKYPNTVPADIIFVLVEEKHHSFTRIGHHLQYTAQITEEQASSSIGFELNIPTLESKPVPFKIYKPLSNLEETRKILGHGLPYYNNPNQRGDIIIKFKLVKSLNKDGNGNKTKHYTQNQPMSQNPPLYINTYYHLEQFLTGYKDSFSLQLPYTSDDGKINLMKEKFEINIQPGTKNGTKFPFPQQSDNEKAIHPTNVIFVATLIRHKYFRRLGLDIVYTAKVSGKIALEGGNIQVPTLEGDILSIPIKSQLDPKKSMDIHDRGLPYLDDNTKRGKLIIWFEITEDENAIMKFIGKAINYLPQIMGP